MEMFIQESIGFIGSALVLISFTLNGEKRIRQVSISSTIVFSIYGIILGAPTLVLMNVGVFLIHIWKLYKLRKKEAQLCQEEQEAR